jgi:hypothetical protein
MEPNDPIPGRVPRKVNIYNNKVAIDRKKKEYASFDLNVLMKQVDQTEHWLPLELFDDITFDDFSNEGFFIFFLYNFRMDGESKRGIRFASCFDC